MHASDSPALLSAGSCLRADYIFTLLNDFKTFNALIGNIFLDILCICFIVLLYLIKSAFIHLYTYASIT